MRRSKNTPAVMNTRVSRFSEYEVELLTMQFGGGYEAAEVETSRWLRSTGVRGAIRFWWRALQAAKVANAKELRDREDAIFGAAWASDRDAGAGRVRVAIEQKGETSLRNAPGQAEVTNGAYFPATTGRTARLLAPGAKAILSVWVCPGAEDGSGRTPLTDEKWSEVCQAVQAYLLFGGSGSRTRCTAGALVAKATSGTPRLPETREELISFMSRVDKGDTKLDVFALGRHELYVGAGFTSAGRAQENILEVWQELRQWRDKPGKRWMQRTQWPEPDAIRWLEKTHARWESGIQHAPEERNRGLAPRAHLGLPMQVKFKDTKVGDVDRAPQKAARGRLQAPDPSKMTLVPEGNERYASPIITTVLELDGQYKPVVLITPSRLAHEGSVTEAKRGWKLDPGDPEDPALDRGAFTRLRHLLETNAFTKISNTWQSS